MVSRPLGLRRALVRRGPCGTKSSRRPAPDTLRARGHLPLPLRGPCAPGSSMRKPPRAGPVETGALLLLAKSAVAVVAGVGDSIVSAGQLGLVTGLDCR